MMRYLLLTSLLMTANAVAAEPALPALPIAPGRITLSGISAGGQMAHQLHIAYSDLFSGAGIVAGGPYGCAAGSLATAMERCMGAMAAPFPVAERVSQMQADAGQGRIAALPNLAEDRVWLFHGSRDGVVAAAVSDALAALYADLLPAQNIRYINDVPAAHHFPARGQGHACGASQSPFVGDCDFDAAGELLGFLYQDLLPPAAELAGELHPTTLPGAAAAGLSDTAYVFVPDDCRAAQQACSLHLVLHGCAQSAVQVGTEFIQQSGYLPWAGANRIVLAFPQVKPAAANPYACWDWWGYTGTHYLWRDGAQMKVLADWLRSLAGIDRPGADGEKH